MIETLCMNNIDYVSSKKYNLIYCDYIYQNKDFSWVDKYWGNLNTDSIFIAQTDDSTMAEIKLKLDSMPDSIWLNTCIMIQEWGGTSKRFFPRKHDYIFIYANGKDYKFYPERIQVEKKTKGTAFDKKGTGLKTPCDVFYDLGNFSTMSNERVKTKEGASIRWQKPLFLFDRIIAPFTNEKDYVLDPFGGVFSLGVWCKNNNRNYTGIESDATVYDLGCKRLFCS